MKKIATLLLFSITGMSSAQAQTSGGPDTYGYTWRDSNDPGGPAYNWIDIASLPGAHEITQLGDDNITGAFPVGFPFHYYWYDVSQFWVGSNGHIGFTNGPLAAPFNSIPSTAGTQNFIAAMGADLLFTPTNGAKCWRYTNPANDTLIVSWLDVPFYSATNAAGAGANTFQLILSAKDSSITLQYKVQTGTPNPLYGIIGIENNSGNIGLQHSHDALPPSAYAIKFYYPANTTYAVSDATTLYNNNVDNGGVFISKNGAQYPLKTSVKNAGNQNLTPYNVFSRVLDATSAILAQGNTTTAPSIPGQIENITITSTFNPLLEGTYSFVTNTQLPLDATPSNDIATQEVVVVDTTLAGMRLSYDSGVSSGAGLSWSSGVGGAGVYFIPPFYPCKVTSLMSYVVANPNSVGYALVAYDDNGIDGSAGTVLDSVYISSVTGGSWNTANLTAPIIINSGGIYVAWVMNGKGLTLGQNKTGPFSNRCFEIFGHTSTAYRNGDAEDLMVNITIAKIDAGIEANEPENDFGNFYPNPSSQTITLNYNSPFAIKKLSCEMYDVQGRFITSLLPLATGGNGELVLNISKLNSGIYYCKIKTENNAVIRKVIVID